jgi:thiamine kinase-like enzyme
LKSLTDDAAAKRMLQLIDAKSALIRRYIERLMTFAKRCRTDFDHFYITHGDAGGNIIVSEDKFYIVDWDETMLAPPERDAWFCMHWSWAMNAFHDVLRQSGIEYALKPNIYSIFPTSIYLSILLKTTICSFKDIIPT